MSVKSTAKEIFGQLVTTEFWKGLGVLVAKTIVETAVEAFFVSFGESLIYFGKNRKKKSEDVEKVREWFAKTNAPAPTPAAAAFSRSFNPSTATFGRDPFPPPPPPPDGGFPGLSPTFR